MRSYENSIICHCEKRSDEAISKISQKMRLLRRFHRLAMTIVSQYFKNPFPSLILIKEVILKIFKVKAL
ncbi:MAG: hypothetical protein HYV52_00775 [Parcubacteria group bacterium]|nr:hypothetical protein [Parcubacteria group bacterium]